MPARVADTPRTVPFKLLIVEFGLGEPEHEISLVALVLVSLNALTDAYCKVFLVEIVENIVFFKL